jgi:hypothetical protein
LNKKERVKYKNRRKKWRRKMWILTPGNHVHYWIGLNNFDKEWIGLLSAGYWSYLKIGTRALCHLFFCYLFLGYVPNLSNPEIL